MTAPGQLDAAPRDGRRRRAARGRRPLRGALGPVGQRQRSRVGARLAVVERERVALDELTPIVYAELRRLAHRYMRRERPDHDLQTSALVNEAYIRLVDYKRMQWQNRAHFFAVSAQLMRRILVEHARRHNLKRGRGVQHVSLDEAVLVGVDPGVDLVALDDALNALARVDPRKVRVVEMRFFGGLSVEETAMVLKVSPVTVRRDWSSAKIWLYRELTGETDDGLGSLETAR